MTQERREKVLNAIRESKKIGGDELFMEVNVDTVLLLFSDCNMHPTLRFDAEYVMLTYPLAYYETQRQRDELSGVAINHAELSGHRLLIEDRPEERLVVATGFFREDQTEELCSALAALQGFLMDAKGSFFRILLGSMHRSVTAPSEPRTLFYSSLALYYMEEDTKESCFHVDFNDVKTLVRKSREFVFYPVIGAPTWRSFYSRIKETIAADTNEGSYTLIMTLVYPPECTGEDADSSERINLHEFFGARTVLFNLMFSTVQRPYSARVILAR